MSIGREIRKARKRKGLTLKDLATRCELSISFLSQAERDICSISIASLRAICDALEVPVESFLRTPIKDFDPQKGEPRIAGIESADSRIRFSILSSSLHERTIEGLLVEVPPHYTHPLISHDGEELGYILEGNIVLYVEDDKRILRPGDSFHIISSARHAISNPNDSIAKFLWVVTSKLGVP